MERTLYQYWAGAFKLRGSPTIRAHFSGVMQPQISAPGTWTFRTDGIATGSVGGWSCKDTRDPDPKPSGIRSGGCGGEFHAFGMFGEPGAAASAALAMVPKGMVPDNVALAAGLNISVLGGSAGFDVLTEPDGDAGGEGAGFSLSNANEAADYL